MIQTVTSTEIGPVKSPVIRKVDLAFPLNIRKATFRHVVQSEVEMPANVFEVGNPTRASIQNLLHECLGTKAQALENYLKTNLDLRQEAPELSSVISASSESHDLRWAGLDWADALQGILVTARLTKEVMDAGLDLTMNTALWPDRQKDVVLALNPDVLDFVVKLKRGSVATSINLLHIDDEGCLCIPAGNVKQCKYDLFRVMPVR